MATFDAAIAAHFATLQRVQGIAAVIARGVATCEATIVLDQGEQAAPNEGAFAVEQNAQQLILKAADYKPTGSVSEPVKNDRITATVNGTEKEWRVVIRGGNQQTFQRMDAKGVWIRVAVVEA